MIEGLIRYGHLNGTRCEVLDFTPGGKVVVGIPGFREGNGKASLGRHNIKLLPHRTLEAKAEEALEAQEAEEAEEAAAGEGAAASALNEV